MCTFFIPSLYNLHKINVPWVKEIVDQTRETGSFLEDDAYER